MRYETGLEREKLVPLEEVRARALAAKEAGATRFCMGAAWVAEKLVQSTSKANEQG